MSNRFLRSLMLLSLFSFLPIEIFADVTWNSGDHLSSANNVTDENIDVSGSIYLNRDVVITANNDMNIKINDMTQFQPDTSISDVKYGHLIFQPAAGATINIYCDYNLYFLAASNADMFVSFLGEGQVVFHLSDMPNNSHGADVLFQGVVDGIYKAPGDNFSKVGQYAVCRAYVAMTNTKSEAIDGGKNRVVFKRRPGGFDQNGTADDHDVSVLLNKGSMFTFISDDTNKGYGAVAFDTSNQGSGKMYVYLKGSENNTYGFESGAFVLYGHYVPDMTSNSDIIHNLALNKIAGEKAILRVIDDDRYYTNINPGAGDARGLFIKNFNKTVPKFAADPYQETNLIMWHLTNATDHPLNGSNLFWAHVLTWKTCTNLEYDNLLTATVNIQTGFVLGKNGRIELAHETFLDYGAIPRELTLDKFLAQDVSILMTFGHSDVSAAKYLDSSPNLKKKNPAALFVDGLYSGWANGFTKDTDAEIFLYGSSKLLLKGALYSQTISDYTLKTGIYNGQYVESSNFTSNEGISLLDLEAPLIVRSFDRNVWGHTYGVGTDYPEINLATLLMDYTGREYDFNSTHYITRPLTKGVTYKTYDSPSVFMNASMQMYDTHFVHSDITKLLSPNPDLALPNIVGGEAKVFNSNVWASHSADPGREELYKSPRFELYNSTFDLHEHFVGAGFKFVINDQYKDKEGNILEGTSADNTSVFKFFDHLDSSGRDLDTSNHGYGRLFMASSSNNKMSDGSTYSDLEDCSIDIFRQFKAYDAASSVAPAETIKLSLQTYAEDGSDTPLIDTSELNNPHHLILLNRATNGKGLMTLGWTTTYGDKTRWPWEDKSGISSNYFDINVTTSGDPNDVSTNTPPATLSIDGNYYYFGGIDSSGNKAVVPVSDSNDGSVIYVNHGGRITITQPDATSHGYDAFVDLPIAYRLWSYSGLNGIIDLPKDQVEYGYGFGRQPYNVNTVLTDAGSPVGVHLNTYNSSNVSGYSGRIPADRYSGEGYILAWANRIDNNIPVKSPSFKSLITRFTNIIDETVTMPSNIVYFGAGNNWADIVTQFKVSGATLADPLQLLIDGYADGYGYAWVKEIVSMASNPAIPGEGDHGIIFLRNSGRIGLGNNSWNDQSISSWKLLGKDFLTISPSGKSSSHDDTDVVGIVDLNSDVFVTDRGAFVAESNFGEYGVDRLVINLNGNDLIVPAGGELDLSSFGQGANRQEIEFAGEGRVVLGHGSTIRFPHSVTPTSVEDYPVLYFNDSTRLVVEDDPELGKGHYTTITDADLDKVKIFGLGQIWLNKNAQFEVMGGAKVRVGSDLDTPDTHIRLSIQRQGDFAIGNEHVRGGSFEVGNPETITDGSIDFELILNGEKARTHLDRGAFMGFGVGMIDKSSDVMNGSSTLADNPSVSSTSGVVSFSPADDAWYVQTLYDVHNITIQIDKGIFDHSNILNGGDRKASMLAFGPLDGSYTVQLTDKNRSKILGGGNIMILKENNSSAVATRINAWDFADPQYREDWTGSDDKGMYNILASDLIVKQWNSSNFANSTVTKISGGGIGFEGTLKTDLFKFLSTPKYSEIATKMVNCGATEYRTYIDYVNTPEESTNYQYAITANSDVANQIYRQTGFSMAVSDYGRPEDGAQIGALGSTGSDEPVLFTTINRR